MIKKRLIAFSVAVILLFSNAAHALAIEAVGACAIDSATGEVIYTKNEDKALTPASLTKIMTLYIIFEKIADGTISKDTLIPVSKNAAELSVASGYTNIPLSEGEKLPLDTLIKAITTVSACASCTAVAEFISGSEEAFAALMNKKAAELNIQAYFTDASGISDYNLISPKGLARLIYLFIKKHPDILNYTKTSVLYIKGKRYTSTNLLLSEDSRYFYSGADGFKTGTTNRAGKCLAATAVKDNRRIISVVMNSKTNASRYTDTIEILNSCFFSLNTTYLYSTDIKAFIDGYEIPCAFFYGSNSLYVVIENLASFGFDVHRDISTGVFYISDNPQKEAYTMVKSDLTPFVPMYKIIDKAPPSATLLTKNGNFSMNNVFSLNGQAAIALRDIAMHFPSYWDSEKREFHIYTK